MQLKFKTFNIPKEDLAVMPRIPNRRFFVFPAALLAVLAAPLAAQTGRDLLVPAGPEPGARLELVPSGSIKAGEALSAARVRDVQSSRHGAVGVPQAVTVLYQYDDGDFEWPLYLTNRETGDPAFESEMAHGFLLPEAGTVNHAVACMARLEADTSANLEFSLNIYSGGGRPEILLAEHAVEAELDMTLGLVDDDSLEFNDNYVCFQLGDDLQGLPLAAGNVWVAVAWQRGTPSENTKVLMMDLTGPGDGLYAFRARPEEGDDWDDWFTPQYGAESAIRAYGIRLAVDHPDPEEGYTDCVPEITPLMFEGGYNVRLCWETPSGEVGEGKGGIWASRESGLLWFFSPGNAEVLVKLLNGCDFNGHRWVFLAPVTDVAFNLDVTDEEGRSWSYRNRQGEAASPARDTAAFPCN